MNLNNLQAFRQAAYNYLDKAKDATFELIDALLITRNVSCLAELSLCPLFRRKWPSIYEALEDCRPQREKLMQLYIEQMADIQEPLLAIDHTSWALHLTRLLYKKELMSISLLLCIRMLDRLQLARVIVPLP